MDLIKKEDLIRKFDKQAGMYEENRKKMILSHWRSQLLQDVKGDVLEVGVGAGANFPYYDPSLTRINAVDFSPEMLIRAKRAAEEFGLCAAFLQSDIETLECHENSFDTIVSTLSLCSYSNPELVLRKFQGWCRKDGRILLMEHGIGANPILGTLQKISNPVVSKFSGCRIDRDMMKIIEQSGMIVERAEHYFFGTIHLVWARPGVPNS
ncbi:class I SAM-dependent methyltransferase [Paenibacillus sp. SI8]|uniref:class I SAM-dependent methyltransferase n=1 Tax=unclassified Paenibacillus TaxID=185978 RepID=UPI003467A77B